MAFVTVQFRLEVFRGQRCIQFFENKSCVYLLSLRSPPELPKRVNELCYSLSHTRISTYKHTLPRRRLPDVCYPPLPASSIGRRIQLPVLGAGMHVCITWNTRISLGTPSSESSLLYIRKACQFQLPMTIDTTTTTYTRALLPSIGKTYSSNSLTLFP